MRSILENAGLQIKFSEAMFRVASARAGREGLDSEVAPLPCFLGNYKVKTLWNVVSRNSVI